MPAIKKVKKEDIIYACVGIIKNEGMESLNARRVAKELKCSTQPIYYIYSNIEEMKNDALKEISNIFYDRMFENNYDRPVYKDIGKNYIKFASEEPILFNLLFNGEINDTVTNFMNLTGPAEKIGKTISMQTGLSDEDAIDFHIKIWLYANGIANLVANGIRKFNEEEIETMLGEQYVARLLLEIKKGNISQEKLDMILKNKLKKKQDNNQGEEQNEKKQ